MQWFRGLNMTKAWWLVSHFGAVPSVQAPYATESPNTVKGVARRRTYHENYESASEASRSRSPGAVNLKKAKDTEAPFFLRIYFFLDRGGPIRKALYHSCEWIDVNSQGLGLTLWKVSLCNIWRWFDFLFFGWAYSCLQCHSLGVVGQ